MSLLDEAFIGWHMNVREIENYAFGTYDVLYGYVESHRFRSCLSVIHESHESLWNWSENFSAKRKSLIKICWVYKNCNKINPWNWNCVMMNKIEDFLIFFPPLHHPPQVSHNSHKFIFQKFNNIVEDEDDEDDSNDNNRECSLSRVEWDAMRTIEMTKKEWKNVHRKIRVMIYLMKNYLIFLLHHNWERKSSFEMYIAAWIRERNFVWKHFLSFAFHGKKNAWKIRRTFWLLKIEHFCLSNAKKKFLLTKLLSLIFLVDAFSF